jgi:hypothetical protein
MYNEFRTIESNIHVIIKFESRAESAYRLKSIGHGQVIKNI